MDTTLLFCSGRRWIRCSDKLRGGECAEDPSDEEGMLLGAGLGCDGGRKWWASVFAVVGIMSFIMEEEISSADMLACVNRAEGAGGVNGSSSESDIGAVV